MTSRGGSRGSSSSGSSTSTAGGHCVEAGGALLPRGCLVSGAGSGSVGWALGWSPFWEDCDTDGPLRCISCSQDVFHVTIVPEKLVD